MLKQFLTATAIAAMTMGGALPAAVAQCAPRKASNPCAPKRNPCAAVRGNPCAPKRNPCAAVRGNPCAPKRNPCAAVRGNPCAPARGNPCAPTRRPASDPGDPYAPQK